MDEHLAVANNINFSQTLQNGLRQELGLEANIHKHIKKPAHKTRAQASFSIWRKLCLEEVFEAREELVHTILISLRQVLTIEVNH